MKQGLSGFSYDEVRFLNSIFKRKTELNRKYIMSLKNENLLQNYYLEAGLWSHSGKPEDIHWGWESPTSQLRGHFLGHWLSAAARIYAATKDMEVKAKADYIVKELARCQRENGGEWAGSTPEKYFHWIAQGKWVWAPHYTVHKTFMGLIEMYRLAGNEQALDIVINWAKWFYRWTGQFTKEQMDDILDFETGGMLEVWADLYEITGDKKYLELMYRYDRRRLFEPLLRGEDVLTNMHANTTIPEVLGAARAWEVTGEQRWRDIVMAYWDLAVDKRGTYCTGGQTCGEVWTPPGKMSARLGGKNQEHCTVYNMMRLAEVLFRWTGDVKYADHWERNLYNGILAQGYWEGSYTHGVKPEVSDKGLIAYFLPLRGGARKAWGSETEDFWCCHGTLVQANATHNMGIYYYRGSDEFVVAQYIPSEVVYNHTERTKVLIRQNIDNLIGSMQKVNSINPTVASRPNKMVIDIAIKVFDEAGNSDTQAEFTLKLRVPWWVKGEAVLSINGEVQNIGSKPSGFISVRRVWSNDVVRLELPKGLYVCPLPDNPDVVAFMDGPVVLAGLCDEERILYGDKDAPETILIPDNEREWMNWLNGYRTYNQERGIRFIPLYEVGYEPYTVYFQIKKR